jgi:uncharacterized integral membrane protein
MKKFKAIVSIILIVLGIIIVVQNTSTVQTNLLFWSISMPRALLLLATALIGFAIGVIMSLSFFKRDQN